MSEEDPRDTVTRMADALDAMLAADDANTQRIAELEEYVKELEADNVRMTTGRTAAEERVKDLTTELRGVKKVLSAADKQLADIRKKEIDPLAEQVALLKAELAAMREAADTADANVIAYRFPVPGAPDIVVRWRGGAWWSVTDGRNHVWTVAHGWLPDTVELRAAHPEQVRFSRADALMHAQNLMEAARRKNPERNP